jgi:hypothetical protein
MNDWECEMPAFEKWYVVAMNKPKTAEDARGTRIETKLFYSFERDD